MAKILYGVQGSGHGHAIRALTVARKFTQHDFLFISFGAGAALLRREFPVVELPGSDTIYRSHQIDVLATFLDNLRYWTGLGAVKRRALEIMEQFQPDVAMADYEFLLPRVARQVGLPCLSLDHQHIIPFCRHPVPAGRLPEYWTTAAVIRLLFNAASQYLVISFFQPPVASRLPVKIAPPLLRDSVLALTPAPGEHVLAYQGHPTFPEFFDFLKTIPRPVVVYGFDRDDTKANLTFRKKSEEGFLHDLSTCAYVVCGGGHTMISEALYYGKPVLSFPIKNAFEQYVNAFYLERLGYGRHHPELRPGPDLIPAFEARLEEFQSNIREARFYGNPEVFALLERYFREHSLF